MRQLAIGSGTALVLLLGVAYLNAAPETDAKSSAQLIRQFAACSSQLGAVLPLQAAWVDGSLVDWGTVKREIEAANPGQTLDLQTKTLTATPPSP